MRKRAAGISAKAWFYGQPGFHAPRYEDILVIDEKTPPCEADVQAVKEWLALHHGEQAQ